jgi:hypothetical protein
VNGRSIGITWLPPFRWDKEMLEKGKRSSNALNLPSGTEQRCGDPLDGAQ